MRHDIEFCGEMEKIETMLCVCGLVGIVTGKLEASKQQTACGGEA